MLKSIKNITVGKVVQGVGKVVVKGGEYFVEKAGKLIKATKVQVGKIRVNIKNAKSNIVKEVDNAKPYSKGRPSYGKNQVEDVWENAKGRDGKVIDPTGKEITWDKSKPRNGQWDMGHMPKKEYRKLHKDYMDGKISKEDFLKEYKDPKNYRPELVKTNRGRKYEKK